MANSYSWNQARGEGTYRLPGPEHLGWWATLAMLISILLHVAVFLLLEKMEVDLRFNQATELSTERVRVHQVDVKPQADAVSSQPEEVIQPPENPANLMEEIDLLAALPKDQEIDIKTDIDEAAFALQMKKPLAEGEPHAVAMETTADMKLDTELPELGREPTQLKPAEIGQVTVDPGTMLDDDALGKFTDDLVKSGANGKVKNGALDGIESLDDLLDLPQNILISKMTMLPSDLLFEFNQAEMRDNAKVGLMKLALLMDRNPNLYCWIEGHTDLIGGDDFNRKLSLRRAAAVKSYLVNSMRMNASKIITRGFGKSQPLVTTGDQDAQAANRRVEIRMRKTLPPAEARPQPVTVAPQPTQAENPHPQAIVVPDVPKPILVKPQRALPVEEEPPVAVPRANPVLVKPAVDLESHD